MDDRTAPAAAPATGAALGTPRGAPGEAAGSADTTARGTVLVVEDEPGLAEVLAIHLQAAGYQPVLAHSGLEALYALERATPAAVVLDLHLPEVSGFRLIQLLKGRADLPRVPVVVLTALSFQEAEEAVEAGADDFLTKPVSPTEVVARIDRLLGRSG